MSPFGIGLDVSVSYRLECLDLIWAWMSPFGTGLDVSV